MKDFKNLVKMIDSQVTSFFNSLGFTYLDYEFMANVLIDKLDIDNKEKYKLRVKFSNKAKQLYYDTVNSGNTILGLLKDEFDFFEDYTSQGETLEIVENLEREQDELLPSEGELKDALEMFDLIEEYENSFIPDAKLSTPPELVDIGLADDYLEDEVYLGSINEEDCEIQNIFDLDLDEEDIN